MRFERSLRAGNEKSGRATAAIGESPHSYLESKVPNEVCKVKGFLGSDSFLTNCVTTGFWVVWVSFRFARLSGMWITSD
jgi:hypothetical protein